MYGNTFELNRLLLRLKKVKGDSEKAALYADLSAESAELAAYYEQQAPDFIAPLKIQNQDTF